MWYLFLWIILLIMVAVSGFLTFEAVVEKYTIWIILLNSVVFSAYIIFLVDSIRDYVIMLKHKQIQKDLDMERSFRKLGGDV